MAYPDKEKRCLYEVLGVSRDCSIDEIRSAYKKLALQRHPDKLVRSGGMSEAEATAQFQELVNAYEVLSDPRERAWYDSHRSLILFSSGTSSSSPSSVHVPDLFSFFSNSVYSGYSDSGKGFYKVYGDVFDKIYQNEVNFAKRLGIGLPKDAPLLSSLDCYYTQVTAFYNYWLGFVTLLDFCWVDQYDVMAGPNRKSRRVMEEENKKLRKKARKEYNDTVRRLAEFVKKRDKRVIDMQMKRNEEIERKKEEERERKEELARQKAERARRYEEPEWATVDAVEDEEEEVIEENTKKGDGKEFYCVACGKKFKSEKQWKNHEQSNRHKEKVAELREAFDNKDEDYEDVESDEVRDEEEEDMIVGEESVVLSADDEVDKLNDQFTSTVLEDDDDVQSNEQDCFVDVDTGSSLKGLCTEMGSDDNDETNLEEKVLGHKNHVGLSQKPKRASKKIQVEVDSDEMDFMKNSNLKGSLKNKGRRKPKGQVQGEAMQSKVPEADVPVGNNGNIDNTQEASSNYLLENVKGGDKLEKSQKLSKPGLDKKASAKQYNNVKSKEATKGRKKKSTTKVSGNLCEACGQEFDSRNKLHKHLGDTGHATLKAR